MKEYTMTQEELNELIEACKPTPYMTNSNGDLLFGTPQDNANAAWRILADKYKFQWDTVESVGSDMKVFRAKSIE